VKKTNVLKRKIYVSIVDLNFPANNLRTKIKIIRKDHSILLYSIIFITKNIKTFKQ